MSDDEDFDAIIIASAKADSGAEGEDDPGLTAILAAAAEAGPPEPRPKQKFVGGDDDLLEATQGMGLKTQSQVESDGKGLFKPWMKFHKFNLVKTVDEVRELIDAALAHGRCALDLECEGLDNRIDYDSAGNPHTKHKIVGYCIGLKGAGYYIPVRHKFDAFVGETNPNVPVDAVDVEIRRLCLASQPKLTEEGLEDDPYGSNKWAEPPKVVLYFWNSKFDQEFLYPVTGIDFWHPDSYEDGMLAAYAIYSDDEVGLKPQAEKRLRVADPELKDGTGKPVSYPYQMIEFKELFRRGTPEDEMRIADLYPDADSDVVRYGCSDGICTELLCEAKRVRWQYAVMPGGFSYKHCVAEALEKHGFTYRIEKQAAQAVRVLERARVQIDKEELEKLRAEAEEELVQYEQKIVKFANARGFKDLNPGSPQALSDFLFSEKGLNLEPKPEKTSEGSDQYKTDATTLEKLWEALPDVEVLSWVVKFRQIDRIIGTYLTGLINNCDANQCLRFNFNQTGAATGRFTAPAGKPSHGYSGIPIQGIPGRDDPKKPKVAHSLRRMFKPRPGYAFAKIDYSGQELRIVTNISREPLWLKEFQEKGADADLHTLTAQAFFGAHVTKDHKLERGMGKTANFALIYGGGTSAVQRATKCDKVEAARRKDNFDKSVPTFAKWVKEQHKTVKVKRGITNAFRRFIAIPDANLQIGDLVNGKPVTDERDVRKIRAGCERKSTNYPIQSAGADVMKISLIMLVKELHRRGWLRNGGDDSVRMVLTVHDEIVFEIRLDRLLEAIPLIKQLMESPAKLVRWDIPLVAEVLLGQTWDAKYNWDELMSGKKPIPEWLSAYLKPGAEVHPTVREVLPAKPQQVEFTDDEEAGADLPANSAPVSSPATPPAQPISRPAGARIPIATFRLPDMFLTRDSIRLVLLAISGSPSSPESQASLRLTDVTGNVLIDPGKFVVDPQRFARELRDRNLGGTGQWEVED